MLHILRVFAMASVLCMAACSTPSSHTAAAPETDGEMLASSSETAGEPAAVAVEDPIVCERVTVVGTRVAQRICMRQSQKDKAEKDAQEALGEVQKRGAIQTQSQQ